MFEQARLELNLVALAPNGNSIDTVPGDSQLIQQAEQWLAVAVAQAGLHLDLLVGIPWVLCVAQHTLNGALPQFSNQRLLQTRLDNDEQVIKTTSHIASQRTADDARP